MFAAGKATSGAAAFSYIEDVFSTYLYNGVSNTALQIQNGIDLSTKGGMVWIKCRSNAVNNNIFDTARGLTSTLESNSANAAQATPKLGSFNTDGFTHATSSSLDINETGRTFASWTFRKQPKFFDIVTYTGNGIAGKTIAHNLGSTPGCIIVKSTSTTGGWAVYHRSLNGGTTPQNYTVTLNSTAAAAASSTTWNNTAPTSTNFTVGTASSVNTSGTTYVAYLFAHDAGGFGLTGIDNVISCGSVTSSGSTTNVTLGYEPQWVLVKRTDAAGSWVLVDSMRGNAVLGTNSERYLFANATDAEGNTNGYANPTATGFQIDGWASGATFIYIAIRRGPMKVPTDGTKVFKPLTRAGDGIVSTVTGVGFSPDLVISNERTANSGIKPWFDKLRGVPNFLTSDATYAENLGASADTNVFKSFDQNGVTYGSDVANNGTNNNTNTYINWFFRRAPSFFDEVCYTGTGTNTTQTHNLGVVPELMIVKARGISSQWLVYSASIPAANALILNTTAASASIPSAWNSTAPTSTVFSLGASGSSNPSGGACVAYLFATCAGVSKVGTYTGNGSSQTINCGFAAGARFILIKRTDSTGHWITWDTARGIVSGNDPHIAWSENYVSEVTTDDTIDPDSSGFIVNQLAATNVNVNAATYIYLAIA